MRKISFFLNYIILLVLFFANLFLLFLLFNNDILNIGKDYNFLMLIFIVTHLICIPLCFALEKYMNIRKTHKYILHGLASLEIFLLYSTVISYIFISLSFLNGTIFGQLNWTAISLVILSPILLLISIIVLYIGYTKKKRIQQN